MPYQEATSSGATAVAVPQGQPEARGHAADHARGQRDPGRWTSTRTASAAPRRPASPSTPSRSRPRCWWRTAAPWSSAASSRRPSATTINKVPLLGDIPFLGCLFQNTHAQLEQDRTAGLHHAQDRDRPLGGALKRGTRGEPPPAAPARPTACSRKPTMTMLRRLLSMMALLVLAACGGAGGDGGSPYGPCAGRRWRRRHGRRHRRRRRRPCSSPSAAARSVRPTRHRHRTAEGRQGHAASADRSSPSRSSAAWRSPTSPRR